jgi:hypothetical protein
MKASKINGAGDSYVFKLYYLNKRSRFLKELFEKSLKKKLLE